MNRDATRNLFFEEKPMQKTAATLKDVNAVYDGPEGLLWELIMGEQVHIGGFKSSKILADKAGIKAEMKGLDLCSCLGAGMRFLARNYGCSMCGVDGTKGIHQKAIDRAKQEGLQNKLEFKLGDVTAAPYPDKAFDFVWGEDAWCYVVDKDKLISEAARVLKPGGTLAFTDWIEGPKGLSDEEAKRINTFMKFPYMESLRGYSNLIEKHGFKLVSAEDLTPEFAGYCDLYIKMLTEQLTYDALKIIGNDMNMFQGLGGEMMYMAQKAHEGKMGRGRFIAVKK
jgi:ubiquinone/menaquinone biosynthesis C-methylase UbiE